MILCSPSDSMWTILPLWCRLFQLNIDISQKKFYQLINSLSRNTFPPWKSLIGHGQVGFFNSFIVTFFFGLGRGFELLILLMSAIICSCLLLVWSVTDYCDHQRRASQFSALYHPALCSVRRYFCFNGFVSYLYFFICTKVIIWKTEGMFNPIGTSKGKRFS